MMRYRFVDEQKADGFPIARVCEIAGVSRSAYHDWKRNRDGVATIRELEEARLVRAIREIHDDSDGTYGSPRVTMELRRQGWVVNHKRVERFWRKEGLKVPAKEPKRSRLWLNDGSCIRLRPQLPNHVWTTR